MISLYSLLICALTLQADLLAVQFCFVHIHIENFTQVVVVEKVRLSKIHFGHWDAVFTRKI